MVSKANGKFTEIKKFGVAKSAEEADALYQKAILWLRTHDGQQEFDFDNNRTLEMEETIREVNNMDAVLNNSTQLH